MSYCITVRDTDEGKLIGVIAIPLGDKTDLQYVKKHLLIALEDHYDAIAKAPFALLTIALRRLYSKGSTYMKVTIGEDYEDEDYKAIIELEYSGLF